MDDDDDLDDLNKIPVMSTITCMCLRSVINLGNSIIGVSILAMPYCFKKCGILLSILLIVASGLITRAACHLLLKSAIMARRRNFEFLAFHTFGPTGKLIVEIGIIGFLIGVCVAFFVVVGDLSPALIAKFLMVENTSHLRAEILIFLGLFVAFPLGLLRKVDSLTSFSAMSIGFYIFLILIIIGEALPKLLNDDWWHQVNWWQPAGLLSSLPIFSMALSCQTQLFEFFDPLNDPSLKKMNSVINGAVQMCLAVYISVGFFGYVAFHDSPITGNILVRLTPSLTAEIIKVGFILSVVISFPLCLFPCRSSLHSLIFKQGMGHYDLQSSYMPDHRFRVLTCALVTATMGMAIMVPNIEFVLGLLGSTIGITICVILPALIFLHLTTKNTNERRMAQLVTFIGFFILIACTFSTLNESKSHEIISQLKPKIEETKIDKMNKPVDNQMYESPNKDKEIKNQEKNELKLQLRKEAEQIVKQNDKNNELNDNKRQEPPVPQESDKNIVKPDASVKLDDLDPEALKKEDKEINSQNKQEEKEKKDEKNLNKQEELLQKLEAQHIEQKKILEEQKKLLEELKMHKESHNEQKTKNNEQIIPIKEQQIQSSDSINKLIKSSPDSVIQNNQPVTNEKQVEVPVNQPIKHLKNQLIEGKLEHQLNQPVHISNQPVEQINSVNKFNGDQKILMIKKTDTKLESQPEFVTQSQEKSFQRHEKQLTNKDMEQSFNDIQSKQEQKNLQPIIHNSFVTQNSNQIQNKPKPYIDSSVHEKTIEVLNNVIKQTNNQNSKMQEKPNVGINIEEVNQKEKNFILPKPIPLSNQNSLSMNMPKPDAILKDKNLIQVPEDILNKTSNINVNAGEKISNQDKIKEKREIKPNQNKLLDLKNVENKKVVDKISVNSENIATSQKQDTKPEVSSVASVFKHEMRKLLFQNDR